MTDTIAELARRLASGEVTSLALTEACLEKIADPAGEGSRTFIRVDAESARETAKIMDAARRVGKAPSSLAGIPISVKALFDMAGEPTTAGSAFLAEALPAKKDAAAAVRLKAAGLVAMGATNMTEFAYSGLGMNPHYGTPGNPADRSRVPGGSSSGAAVSVADGMAYAGLGTDTGGSCRIPAAFCGIVGFKPTARRVPTEGAFPLSKTLDSIGPLAGSVEDCALIDAILAGEEGRDPETPELSSLKLAVLENYVLEGMSPHVAAAFEAGVKALEAAGASVTRIALPDLERLPEMNANGGIVAAEAMFVHEAWLATRQKSYDPRVASRILKARSQRPGEYAGLLKAREAMIAAAAEVTSPFDAVLMPTTPIEAPVIAELDADDAAYGAANVLALRNPSVGNFLDRCAISIPLPVSGLPVGLTLMGETMSDRRLFAVARAAEAVLAA